MSVLFCFSALYQDAEITVPFLLKSDLKKCRGNFLNKKKNQCVGIWRGNEEEETSEIIKRDLI